MDGIYNIYKPVACDGDVSSKVTAVTNVTTDNPRMKVNNDDVHGEPCMTNVTYPIHVK